MPFYHKLGKIPPKRHTQFRSDAMKTEVPIGKGLSEQLHASVRGRAPGEWTVMDFLGGFHAVVEGRIRSPGLLLSQQFPEFIEALRHHYRLILVTAPERPSPIDLQALGDVCDEVLVVLDGRASQRPPTIPAVLAEKVFRTMRLGGAEPEGR